MSDFNESSFGEFFQKVTAHSPFPYQLEIARCLFEGKNVMLRAPTGAGKTWSVLVPFLFPHWKSRPARMIYALPLRTLAEGIYIEALDIADKLGLPVETKVDSRGHEIVSPFATLQTGEQPDDRFFDRGRIIVTTYDQLLSGLLCGPYGLSNRLHNVNAAVFAGSLVVFDEFHLMETHRSFLTAVSGLRLFRNLCQSVWMTATATQPLERLLQEALTSVSIPANDQARDQLFYSLPSVTEVTRHISVKSEPISAEAVLALHNGRSLVLLNTVGRAQSMFDSLQQSILKQRLEISLMLLHSRFFKEDRRAKEEKLRSLFGKQAQGSAILVATQVVEAGLDISCNHLHTEICPMNALVQRAGRCARFPGERGTVHVYALPDEERAWLPYGDVHSEGRTLILTRELLERIGNSLLNPVLTPVLTSDWVQEVHAADDELTLRQGWRPRLQECLRRIEQNAIVRDPKRVADLIRGDDTDTVRVIINDEMKRPESPGLREGLSLSRRSLYRLFQNGQQDFGWFWEGSEENPWRRLQSPSDLHRTYVVCLRPSVAFYSDQIGLRLGVSGTCQSPFRTEPKRPGYAPLHAEAWPDHAQRVAAEARKRLERENYQDGLLGHGFQNCCGITPQNVLEAVEACSLLHDLGKLQQEWQYWSESAQRSKHPGYRHDVLLAHTDFDPDDPQDLQRLRSLGISRPPHAPASAYYGRAFLGEMLSSIPDDRRAYVVSACTAAILAHHGGWWPQDFELSPPKLCFGWLDVVTVVVGRASDQAALGSLTQYKMVKLLAATTASDNLIQWWPLVAYLTRTLRLSDQRATAEAACHE